MGLLRRRRPDLVVSEERGVRHLHVGGEAIQSAMRLEEPYALELDYTRCMMAFLLFHPEPRRALMIGLGSLVGRFAVGSIADYFGRMRSLALMYLSMALMLLLWWASTGTLALTIVAVGFGVSYGGFVATFPTVVMDLFGARSVSGIIGCIYTAAGVGTLFGPPVAGAAFDATGSYSAPILGAAALALIAAVAVRSLRAGS